MGNRAETPAPGKERRRAMTTEKLQYKLKHPNCGTEFNPQKTSRLWCEQEHAKKYKYQDLMEGVCPKCKEDVLAWIGVNFLGEAESYNAISHKKHRKWIDRFDADLERTHSKKDHLTVKGCVYDRNSGKHLFRENIPVI
jgi:predicted N-acyltransferase